jgi:hypothetical protein
MRQSIPHLRWMSGDGGDLIQIVRELTDGWLRKLMAIYWPKYHPIPYRSKKLVTIVSELA